MLTPENDPDEITYLDKQILEDIKYWKNVEKLSETESLARLCEKYPDLVKNIPKRFAFR